MLSSLDLAAVNSFLITARKEIDKNNAYFVYYRNVKSGNKVVNARQALLDIGIIKISEIWNHIKELQPSDCFRISRDRDFSRDFNAEIYEFKKIINRKNVYIKLTINDKGLLCISFHIDNGGN